ncbi:MAG: sulfatase [Myxococcota bacterium]
MVARGRSARRAAAAAALATAALACSEPSAPHRPDIVLIVADTLRADHLGCYGYTRAPSPTSPHIDALARESLLFAQAVSAAPWTSPSVASLFTGLYPSAHGVVRSPVDDDVPTDALARAHDTLAERLARAGYATIGITANPWVSRERGYAQGFDLFAERAHANASEVAATARALLGEVARRPAPFFLYVQLMDPHLPNEPPAELVDRFHPRGAARRPAHNALGELVDTLARYDAEVFALDAGVGELIDALRELGRWEDAVVVFVADHGEQIFDHGEYGHGRALFAEEVHVPLLLRARGLRGIVDPPVSSIDVAPTLLALAGADGDDGGDSAPMQGVSLLDDAALRARGGAFSEATMRHNQKAFVDADGAKLILDFPKRAQARVAPMSDAARVALLGARPGLGALRPEIEDETRAARLEAALRDVYARSLALGEGFEPDEVVLDAATRAQLEALGYGATRDEPGDADEPGADD